MDTLLIMVDTILMVVLCYWARMNDAAGNSGTPGGLFAYHTEQPPLEQTSGKT